MSLLERTLSDIARPCWEGTRAFERVWRELVSGAQNLDWPRETREWCCSVLPRMASARVLVIEGEQLDALPFALDQDSYFLESGQGGKLQGAIDRVTLPFDPVFIDLGGGSLAPHEGGFPWCAIAALVDGKYLTGFTECQGKLEIAGDFARLGDPRAYFPHARSKGWGQEGFPQEGFQIMLGRVVERTAALLQWLESMNVEIGDAAVSRQVRRAAERKGAQIAKVVRVKLPRSWRNGQPPSATGTRNWSHRWEVAGHYMYFSESTRLAQAAPDKLSWVPEREGYFRRLWCPPHVKGPADKPLIPKSRKLVGLSGEKP